MANHVARLPMTQSPAPGERLVRYQGNRLTFTLAVQASVSGTAWLRTNLGRAAVRREEVIGHVERGDAILARDWHDLPMRRIDAHTFAVSIPLVEIGSFAAKAFFLPDGSTDPEWPAGDNTRVKVAPAFTCAANATYTAFVRQFAPQTRAGAAPEAEPPAVRELDARGYTVIPHSGRFRDLARELDHIMGTLGFRILQLLPVFPTPTTYARMGRFGSPFAALDFMDVEPALAEFDRQTTPMDQFRELVDAVHARGGRLLLDIPINHTGWSSWLQNHHPQWFMRREDRTFRSPGAWGVTWEDLSELDYRHRELWRYMADVFLFWCRQGVDGFRCDAGYMVPYPVWEYIVARVRAVHPETLFLLEGLGGKQETTEALLAGAGLDWAYSEIFQSYDRSQLEAYLPACAHVSSTCGTLIHFAETHDNNRLAARSPHYARLRTALAALCAETGAFGITNGVEWFAAQKVDVHGAAPLRWGHADNQVAFIARLNAVLRAHPAFFAGAAQRLIHGADTGNALALRRTDATGRRSALVLVNLDDERPGTVAWPAAEWSAPGGRAIDLLDGAAREASAAGGWIRWTLAPGAVHCLAGDAADLAAVERCQSSGAIDGDRIGRQRARAKVFALLRHFGRPIPEDEDAIDAAAGRLLADPYAFCAAEADGGLPPVTRWAWPRDLGRVVMAPPGHLLLVDCPHPFTVRTAEGGTVTGEEKSLAIAGGRHAALVPPPPVPAASRRAALEFMVFEPGACRRAAAEVLWLGDGRAPAVRTSAAQAAVAARGLYALATNGRGGMAQVNGAWGAIRSQYDALLAANLDPEVPVDRRVLLTRCRAWLVLRGFSYAIDLDALERFEAGADGVITWRLTVPCGSGRAVPLAIALAMRAGANAVDLAFRRERGADAALHLDDGVPVQLVLRPDIEDRGFHDKTKAYTGPEQRWPAAVHPRPDGFDFAPGDHRLRVTLAPGTFTADAAWTYMVPHPVEADRGLDGASDLFSPGYFTCALRGGETAVLQAAAVRAGEAEPAPAPAPEPAPPGGGRPVRLDEALRAAIGAFVVRRNRSLTVIAGYPWFLDWGRDTLIALRGLIAAGLHREARDILLQFARFEDRGTLPNMIRGNDHSNRDTSDAPLWFFTACADLCAAAGEGRALLDADCGGRPLRAVLGSIARHYRDGTPNGIRTDPATGLVFSPPHFTWMDTNHPAATPREGYPIEIQALWHAALRFLAAAGVEGGDWGALAGRVAEHVAALYVRPGVPGLADCLHCGGFRPAARAEADDALRPNQLLAVTLGCVADAALGRQIVAACEELLVPGAIRSLADRPVRHALPVVHHGALLNDPLRPYWGEYRGDEDTRRKPAYHNGTAWTWVFPSYCEALVRVYGPRARAAARALLGSVAGLAEGGCLGHLPEIVDGNAPHAPRGCGAQAWSVTEAYRVWRLLAGTQGHGRPRQLARTRRPG